MIQRSDRRGEFPRLCKRPLRNSDLPRTVEEVIVYLNHALALAICKQTKPPLSFNH
jgi:hypothetical protein